MPTNPTSPNIATLPGVNPFLPAALGPLVEVAYNLHWSTSTLAQECFARLDPILWDQTGHNPVRMLVELSPHRLEALALDEKLVEMIGRAREELRAHLGDRGWYGTLDNSARLGEPGYPRPFLAAYFCAEFGLHECFQIYSGGLGLLAGDHLKAASDLGLPLIGVGLLYRNGYFHQKLDAGGMQVENYPALDAPRQPVLRVMDLESGRQLTVGIHLPGREVRCALWRADVGKVRLYLLDTNIPENAPEDREITANLYLGDQNRRIQQELVLGIGGVRALNAIGERPTVYHMNEGHAAFLAVERIREIREGAAARGGLTFDQAREFSAAGCVFTTHTPVPAGIDRFGVGLMTHYFGSYVDLLGLDMEGFLALGRENVTDQNEHFSMAILALRCSKFANGVSALHGVVSRAMWAKIWPDVPEDDVPIGHVTNGVHPATWISTPMAELYDKHLEKGWEKRPQDAGVWAGVDRISDAELWSARNRSREQLVRYVRTMAGYGKTAGMTADLRADVVTIGFARRFAGYKRGTLLLRDADRLAAILRGKEGGQVGGVQFLISGKAHPGDSWGKSFIREIVQFARSEKAGGRIVFLEDYGIDVAREMVRGCDVWLNTPIRGLEASGTSGMKAAMNGVMHASILDGWWDEGYSPPPDEPGFKIEDSGIYPNDAPNEERETFESDALYRLIEGQIVPDFYQREGAGANAVPRRWTARMRTCIKQLAPFFSTQRMVAEYATKFYFPAHQASAKLVGPDGSLTPAREVSDHIDRYRKLWHPVRVKHAECAAAQGGEGLAVAASVRLGMLRPDEVLVQAYHGPVDEHGNIPHGHAAALACKAPLAGGDGTYHYTGLVAQTREKSGAKGRHYGLVVRVLPGDPRLVTPFIPGLIATSGPLVARGEMGHL
jgi:starch phosphorylase